MTLRSTLAGLLEGAAATLRASEARAARPVRTVVAAATATGDVVKDQPKPANETFPHPVGFWLCTVSTFDDFVVGCAYSAVRNQTSVRISPYADSYWAPYWVEGEGRFCYPRAQLDFIYIGRVLPRTQMVDARTRDQRIAERRGARLAA